MSKEEKKKLEKELQNYSYSLGGYKLDIQDISHENKNMLSKKNMHKGVEEKVFSFLNTTEIVQEIGVKLSLS